MNLFWSRTPDLYEFLEQRKKKALDWLVRSSDEFFAITDEQVFEEFSNKFGIEPIVFDFAAAEVIAQGAKKINVQHDHRFMVAAFDEDLGINPYVNGNYLTFAIPYKGASELFQYRGQNHTLSPIVGEVHPSEVHIILEDAVEFTEQSLSKLRNELFASLAHCAAGSQSQVAMFGQWLYTEGQRLIQNRKKEIATRLEVVQKLGFKIRKRDEQPINVSEPIVRKKLSPLVEKKMLDSVSVDPSLDIAIYEEILSVCRNMALVMELSPQVFSEMEEEHLRFHFLVQLNGVFEGNATGETFNLKGKTDILIKFEGKNLFIAECKYWKGEENYRDALEQLHRYISWRDTKTAIIIFNRNKDFSSVLSKLRSETLKHRNCLGQIPYDGQESSFRFGFKYEGDSSKTFLLTVMAFNIPAG